ncbi:hypothetical protein [Borreliella valaisiana]|uniref:hypothetical protein n=1 Tax=Borreliella valaisiana TaxID=62088 RepID=UPI003B9DD53A
MDGRSFKNLKSYHGMKQEAISKSKIIEIAVHYPLDNGLQIQTYSLICSNEIPKYIKNLNKNRLLYMYIKN